MAVKLPDTAVPMGNFPVAYSEHILFEDDETLQEKFDNGSLGGGGAGYKQLSQAEYDALSDDEKMNGKEYRTIDTGHIYKLGVEYGKETPIDDENVSTDTVWSSEKIASELGGKVYTSLAELELTADATIEDVVNALKNGESFLAPVNTFTNYETIFPNNIPSDQWNKIHIIKGASFPNSHIRCFSQSGACEYLANVNNTNVVGWNDVSGTYIDISDAIIEKLGNEILKYPIGKYRINSTTTGNKFTDLPSDAEIKCGLIEVNGTAVGKSPFTDKWVYRMYKFECLAGTLSYVRRLSSGATAGQIELDTGWRRDGQETYTSLAQMGLTADATVQNVIDALKEGETALISTNEFTNYKDGMFPNQCSNDLYAVIKVVKESGSKAFLEWRQKEGNAYAIGGLNSNNKFTNWNNLVRFKKDGFADDSIICIGDILSSDGVIQTLANLGFTTDVMTWDTGIYRVSHISGLTNLPSDLPSASPGFRLEHYDCKKWGGNHNPNTQTWAMRHSVLYIEGGKVYHRYTESGATAGVYTKDTGWQQISCGKYYSIYHLNSVKGKSIELVANTDNTLKIVEALSVGEEFVEWFGNSNNRFGIPTTYGYRINYLRIQKTTADNAIILAVTDYGKTFSRVYNAGKLEDWCFDTHQTTLVTNAQNFKLDITKNSSGWYGFFKLEYLYGYHLCEICIGISSTIAYTVTKGKNLIDKITYTINGANIVLGIDFTTKVYGIQVVEMPREFGKINSLTAESFTGSTVANQTGLDLELHKQTKVVTSLDKGTWQVGQRIKQKTDFTANTNDACFEFVAKNENSASNGKHQKMTIYQLTPIENGTNASLSFNVYEDGKAQVTVWPATKDMPRNDYNLVCEGYLKDYVDEYVDVSVAKKQNVYSTSEAIAGTWVDGKTIYRKTIKYTFSSSSSSGSNSLELATISGLTHLISANGVYQRTGYTDFAIPYCKDANNHAYVTCNPANKKIFLNVANFNSGDIAYITVEYIK
jgi:hypothetical protein